jgi:hypothetical protein
MKRYHSKIGALFLIPVLVLLISLSYSVYNETKIFGIAVLITISSFILDLICRTYYFIKDDYLFIRCGIFTTTIEVKSIRKISDSKNLISSPALSIDRLEIIYNKFDSVLISPKDKAGIINDLKQANPDIIIKSKSTSASP